MTTFIAIRTILFIHPFRTAAHTAHTNGAQFCTRTTKGLFVGRCHCRHLSHFSVVLFLSSRLRFQHLHKSQSHLCFHWNITLYSLARTAIFAWLFDAWFMCAVNAYLIYLYRFFLFCSHITLSAWCNVTVKAMSHFAVCLCIIHMHAAWHERCANSL